MRLLKLTISLFCLLLLTGCAGWRTRFSLASSASISIYLYKEGSLTMTMGGIGHITKEQYEFRMTPGKLEYLDDEVKMYAEKAEKVTLVPVRGSVSFDKKYTTITIKLDVESGSQWLKFEGNGRYRINGD